MLAEKEESVMSNIVLRFFPANEKSSYPTSKLLAALQAAKIVGEPVAHWASGDTFAVGAGFGKYVGFAQPGDTDAGYAASLVVGVEPFGQGVLNECAEPSYPDRSNVVSIYGGDGSMESVEGLLQWLTEQTRQVYQVGWDLM